MDSFTEYKKHMIQSKTCCSVSSPINPKCTVFMRFDSSLSRFEIVLMFSVVVVNRSSVFIFNTPFSRNDYTTLFEIVILFFKEIFKNTIS